MTKMKNKVIFILLSLFAGTMSLYAADGTVCAQVQLQIVQEITFERLAFDAELKLSNNLDNAPLENIRVDVKINDENGVAANEVFFVKVNGMRDINSVDGTGIISPLKTGVINWLIIPGKGAGGEIATGKRYSVKADIFYGVSDKQYKLETWEDWISVKPEPGIILDYFLPNEVTGDDPLTEGVVEESVPFMLAVRAKNTGYGVARDFKIDSSQPEIINNEKGLLADYEITGSWLHGESAPDTLQINFGDIVGPYGSVMAYWNMLSSLKGEFNEFTASFSHSQELGGAQTSLIEAVYTHYLIKDVLVDTPGRDNVIDFFSDADKNGTPDSIYESEGASFTVIAVEASAGPPPTPQNNAVKIDITSAVNELWGYIQIPDPCGSDIEISEVLRSDGKIINSRNYWVKKSSFYLVDIMSSEKSYTLYYDVTQMDNIAPVTAIFIGEPKYGEEPVYITSKSSISLTASDDISGVELTEYRIGDDPWGEYTAPFVVLTAEENIIYYRSKDVVGNLEDAKELRIYADNVPPSIFVEFEGQVYLEKK